MVACLILIWDCYIPTCSSLNCLSLLSCSVKTIKLQNYPKMKINRGSMRQKPNRLHARESHFLVRTGKHSAVRPLMLLKKPHSSRLHSHLLTWRRAVQRDTLPCCKSIVFFDFILDFWLKKKPKLNQYFPCQVVHISPHYILITP